MSHEPPPLAYAAPVAVDEEASRRSARRLIAAGVVAWSSWHAIALLLQEAQVPFWIVLRADAPLESAARVAIAAAVLAAIAGGALLFRGRRLGARVSMAAATLYLSANAALWLALYTRNPTMFTGMNNGAVGVASQAMGSLGYLVASAVVVLATAPPVARVLRLR